MKMHTNHSQKMSEFDYIGIGLGPFNLGFTCMAAPLGNLNGRIFEQASAFCWHPGMLIEGATLQNPFLGDLVSMADPTSPFTYLNFCKQKGRLYQLYIRENFYLGRADFNEYCQWVIQQLDNIDFGHKVVDIHYEEKGGHYRVSGVRTNAQGQQETFCALTKKLLIGVGSGPQFPSSIAEKAHILANQSNTSLIHSGQYLKHKKPLQECKEITVIGSGQSGAEIFYDLLTSSKDYDYKLNWVTRSARYFQMETAKFALEILTPDYAEYFFGLKEDIKTDVLKDHQHLYKGINQKLINGIYDALDENHRYQHCQAQLLPCMEIVDIHFDPQSQQYHLHFKHTQTNIEYLHKTDAVIFATGYKPVLPDFIEGIRNRLQWYEDGSYLPNRNWSVDKNQGEVFIQNAGLKGHGITNPDLGMACYRNSRIIHAMTGVDHYPAEASTSFQQYQPLANSGFEEISEATQEQTQTATLSPSYIKREAYA